MDGGFQQSAFRLNKYVVTQTTWGKPQVNERATQLGEVAKRRGHIRRSPRLNSHQNDSAPEYTLESYQYLNASNPRAFREAEHPAFLTSAPM